MQHRHESCLLATVACDVEASFYETVCKFVQTVHVYDEQSRTQNVYLMQISIFVFTF